MDDWKNLNYNLILRAISFRIIELEREKNIPTKTKEELAQLKKEYKKLLKVQQQSNK